MAIIEQFESVTDLAISTRQVDQSLVFPGPIKIQDTELLPYAKGLLDLCREIKEDEFTVQHDGIFWRGHWDNKVIDGRWIRLRKQPSIAPCLDTLPVNLPKLIAEMLMSPSLSTGGLVLVVGATGSGKTTTASATVVSRLRRFGGLAYTVEDPPELPLNGWHGEGYCTQTSVIQGEITDPWGLSLKGALRSQPAGTATILFVGEIREANAARIALQGASKGFLVIATSFASDIISGIEAYAKLAGADNHSMLADQLRIVVYQNLTKDILRVNVLVSRENSSVAGCIRKGMFPSLQDEFNLQKNLLLQGNNLLDTSLKAAA